MKRFILLLSIMLLMSCVHEIQEPQESSEGNPSETSIRGQTKASGNQISELTDTVNTRHRMQSNPYIIMSKQVCFGKDGKAFLMISVEDAKDVGIPNEIYSKFLCEIERLNNTKTNAE